MGRGGGGGREIKDVKTQKLNKRDCPPPRFCLLCFKQPLGLWAVGVRVRSAMAAHPEGCLYPPSVLGDSQH